MKKIMLLPAIVICFGFHVGRAGLTGEEREFAIRYMKQTKEDLLRDVQGLSAAQFSFKSSPERWSIYQCLEHIAIAEKVLIGLVQDKVNQPADPSLRDQAKLSDTAILRLVTDRSRKGTAPDFLQPAEKFSGSEQAIQAFIKQRDKNMDYIQSTNDDLRNHFMQHPVFGTVDDYQFVLIMAAHSRRHTLQIEEVKADPNFPKN